MVNTKPSDKMLEKIGAKATSKSKSMKDTKKKDKGKKVSKLMDMMG